MIDFRSDTVTTPCAKMRAAMANASVGDDVYGDDPSVNALEEWAAQRHGFEAALFCSSGTQANLLALMSHCERGDEYLCGQQAHNYQFEGGGAAVLGSIQPQPIANEPNGTLCLTKLKQAIKPDDFHFARTKLISIENTINGKVLPLSYLANLREFAKSEGLALHLDGARVYNAAVALNVDITDIAKNFDSMTVCLSKGLGAPIGSLLFGSKAFIAKARRWRKMLGGGMRQVGVLAAAAEMALKDNVVRLAEDHSNAKYLGEQLNQINGIKVNVGFVETNMVFATLNDSLNLADIANQLLNENIRITAGNPLRLVTHLNISKADIDVFINKLSQIIK